MGDYNILKQNALDELKKQDYDVVVATNYLTLMALDLFNTDCPSTKDYFYIDKMRSNLKSLNYMITHNNL